MQEALAEAFAGGPAFDPGTFDPGAFDPAALTPVGLVAVQVGFFTGVLFLGIACDAGKAWNRAPDVRSTIEAEDRLREIVGVSVDKRLSPLLDGRIRRATRAEIEALGRRAIEEVWSDWEKYR